MADCAGTDRDQQRELLRKPLGPVSAYALARKYGYKGTEEEFATLQAESGNNAQRAETAADRAEQVASQNGYVYFKMDERGHIIFGRTDNVENLNFVLRGGRMIQQWLTV